MVMGCQLFGSDRIIRIVVVVTIIVQNARCSRKTRVGRIVMIKENMPKGRTCQENKKKKHFIKVQLTMLFCPKV